MGLEDSKPLVMQFEIAPHGEGCENDGTRDEVVGALVDFVKRTAGPGYQQPEALEALPAIAELVLDYA